MIDMLVNKIKDYYLSNFEQLSEAHQFHFASRLAAWNSDEQAIQKLVDLQPSIIASDEPDESLVHKLKKALEIPMDSQINALGSRQEFFDTHPRLRGIDFTLFKLRHWLWVYGIDRRDLLEKVVSRSELDQLQTSLLNDLRSIAFLSTYAVNYLYLMDRVIYETNKLKPEIFLGLESEYDLSNPVHLQIYIYLYTHCIIGETNFYAKSIPTLEQTHYLEMLRRLEQIIENNFENINLDNKLEFLVCAKILNASTAVEERIRNEAESSLSPDGDFLVDTHNNNVQSTKTSFKDSEHRNVLYIMSCSDYFPKNAPIFPQASLQA